MESCTPSPKPKAKLIPKAEEEEEEGGDEPPIGFVAKVCEGKDGLMGREGKYIRWYKRNTKAIFAAKKDG